jgi:hypothetical protein
MHDSMNWAWRILEYIPKNKKWHDNPETKKKSGLYLPNSEPRFIPDDAIIHTSVQERLDTGKYDPPNLPKV